MPMQARGRIAGARVWGVFFFFVIERKLALPKMLLLGQGYTAIAWLRRRGWLPTKYSITLGFESFKLKMPCRAGVAFLLSDE